MIARAILRSMAAALALAGCQGAEPPAAQPSISYKVKAENASARIEREFRLSESETVKTIMVPGFPYGSRCVVYQRNEAVAMQCAEVFASQQ